MKKTFFLLVLSACTLTNIDVKNENGSTCTVDTSTTANPNVQPDVALEENKAKSP